MPFWMTADHQAAPHGVHDAAASAEQAGAADDGRADGQQQGVAGAEVRGHRLQLRGLHDTGHRGQRGAEHEHRDADPVNPDTGPARGLVVAADGVDVAPVAGPAEQEGQADRQDDQQQHHPGDALDLQVVEERVLLDGAVLTEQVDEHRAQDQHQHRLGDGDQRRLGLQAGRALADRDAQLHQGVAAGHHGQHDPAQPQRHQVVVVALKGDDRLGRLVRQRDRAGLADLHQHDALEGQERGQGDDERGDAGLGAQPADGVAEHGADDDRGHHGPVPGHVVAHDHDRHQRRAHAGGGARAQVDLAEQQHEHQAHGQHDDRRGLGDQVGDVVQRQEAVLHDREEDDQDDQADHGGRRAQLAAARPVQAVAAVGDQRAGRAGRRRLLAGGGGPGLGRVLSDRAAHIAAPRTAVVRRSPRRFWC